ncbi:MAG: FxLYD domain-containing protein [Bryobacterales bacterium]
MFESPKQIEQKGPSSMVGLVVLALALVGATAGWFLYQRSAAQTDEQPQQQTGARLLPNFAAERRHRHAGEKRDALGQTLLEITGSIQNTGDRICSLIQVNVVFHGIDGVEIERQRAYLVDRRTGPLEPGETQPFRMAFDNIPQAWNQAFPSLFISQIDFAD